MCTFVNFSKKLEGTYSIYCFPVKSNMGVFFMEKKESSLYGKFSSDLLAGFFYTINKNIRNGILSNAMYHEIILIQQAALREGSHLTTYMRRGHI